MGQGITVNILAKIEGWLSLIKEISNALKNLKPGTSMSESLLKELTRVNGMVTNLGKNLNLRLTSDSAISSFTDKMRGVEEVFSSIGSRMSNISFADLDPSYITSNFKELVDLIETAKAALTTGETNSFLSLIGLSQELLAIFKEFKFDPTGMGIDLVKAGLKEIGTALEDNRASAEKLLEAEKAKVSQYQELIGALKNSKLYTTDTSTLSQEVLSGIRPVDKDKLNEYVNGITSALDTMGPKVEKKREEINLALLNLINANTTAEVRLRIDELRTAFEGTGQWKNLLLDLRQIEDLKNSFLAGVPSETEINAALTTIRENLVNGLNISDTGLLNKAIGSARDLITKGDWDKLPDMLAKIIDLAKDKLNTLITLQDKGLAAALQIVDQVQARVTEIRGLQTQLTNAQDLINSMLEPIRQENAELRQRVESLELQLKSLATATTTGLGSKLGATSAQGMIEATQAAKLYTAQLDRVKSAEQMVGKILGVVLRWFSVYAVIRMVRQAILSMINTIKELDKTITNIAIVTDMDQDELWGLMPKYTQMARDYGASISGVYEVSLLYYQQGLLSAEVFDLTAATLKMARISGLDYADATDYMTNAVRSFKMEMSEANTVVDVYSAIAASSATSVTELATAMSKTASSAEAVGSSFENTTAMMAVMIEATRESPENIGSAMKSIISRYGELKENKTGIDEEGEAYSLNKVDTALLSVGITIHDTEGKFRDFDDVIAELANKWDTIDVNTLRYIATVMAGNRQQSRFLALVSSGARLTELSEKAADSEDASQLLFLKSLDSVDTKVQLLLTSILNLYTSSGLEKTYKSLIDFANRVVMTLNSIGNNLGIVGIGAKIATTFATLTTLVNTIFKSIKTLMVITELQVTANLNLELELRKLAALQEAEAEITALQGKAKYLEKLEQQQTAVHNAELAKLSASSAKAMKLLSRGTKIGMISSALGLAATTAAAQMGTDTLPERTNKGLLTITGGALSGIGMAAMISGPAGWIMGALTLIPSLLEGIDTIFETAEERALRLSEELTNANNERIKAESEYKNMKSEVDELKELEAARYDSAEAMEAYIEASNKMAEENPDIVGSYDAEGNAIIDLERAYKKLADARGAAAEAGGKSASKAIEVAENKESKARQTYALAIIEGAEDKFIEYTDSQDLTHQFSAVQDRLLTTILGQVGESTQQADITTQIYSFLEPNGEASDLLSIFFALSNPDNLDNLSQIFSDDEVLKGARTEIERLKSATNQGFKDFGTIAESYLNLYTGINTSKQEADIRKAEVATLSAKRTAIMEETKNRVREMLDNEKYLNDAMPAYFDEFSGALSIINTIIEDALGDQKWDDFVTQGGYDKAFEEGLKLLNDYWTSLAPNIDEVEDLLKNRKTLTKEQFSELLADYMGIKDANDLDKILNALWPKSTFDFSKAVDLRGSNTTLIDWKERVSDFFGEAELLSLLTLDKSLMKLVESGNIDLIGAQTLMSNFILAAGGASEEIQSLIFDTDIFSLTSILSTIDKIKSQDNYETDKLALEAVTKLQDILNLIPLNLNTEANTLLDTFTEGLSDTETSIKNASKGMDFKTVQKEIERLGTDKYSINDFVFRDGKYYIQNYVKLANDLMNDAISLSGVELLEGKLDDIKQLTKREDIQKQLGISKTQWNTKIAEFQKTGGKFTNGYSDFIDWYYADLMQNVTAGQEYIRDQFARLALESGDIKGFLQLIATKETVKSLDDVNALVSAIISNNLDGLTDELRAMLELYSTLLNSTYKSIQTSIGTAMLKSLSGEEDYIEVTETNLEALKQNKFITNAKDLAIGGRAKIDTKAIRDSLGGFASWLVNIYKTESDLLKALQDYHDALYKNNPAENLDKLLDDETIAFNDLTEYFVSIGAAKPEDLANSSTLSGLLTKYGLVMTSTGDLLVENYENYINALTKDLQSETFTGLNQIERNEKIAKIETAKFAKELNFKTVVDDLIKNLSTITAELRANFANALLLPYLTVEKYFTRNGDGTFRLNVSEILALLEDKSKNLSLATLDYLSSQLTEITDSYMDNISNAVSLTTSGTTKQADLVAFLRQFEQLTGKTFKLTEGFTYNDVLDAWTLNPEVLNEYIKALAELLVELGLLNKSDIDKWINDLTNNLIRSEMDITSILDDSDTNALRESASKLANSVRDYLALGNKIYDTDTLELIDLLSEASKHADFSGAEAIRKRIEDLQGLTTEQIMNTLYAGGLAAVNVLTLLKGDLVTADEISAVYNAGINRLTAAEEALSSGAGTILTGIAAQIAIAADDIETQELPDGSVVITNVTSMVDAYARLYGAMSLNSTSTTALLNSLYAKMLTAADLKNIDALDTLENASGMTYDAFGELLASYGIKLEDAMKNASEYGITTDGFGKVIITNFQRFAKQMDWDIDSPEYAEAYNSYIDSLAELQNKPQEYMDTVVEQIQGISELLPGKVMNASAIEKMFSTNHHGRKILQHILAEYGATLENGLLQISDDTDVLGLISAISEKAAEAGTLLPEQLAELNDAIFEYLQNIAGLINDGISGTLSNADANTLLLWATKLMGLNDLEFTLTSEGLKLSLKSAIELYHTLKDIDEIQAKIVFDELNDTLKETNEHYKGISDIAARIAWIEDEKHPERLSLYADELELAKEIYAVRSTTEDDSFNFMSNEIPGALNNPINYYNNWADAISKLKTAMKTKVTNSTGTHKGLIDYSDWYNIVTELNNLAARTGKAVKVGKDIKGNAIELDGSMESAAELIQKGAQTLTADASGNIKVALGDIGIDFSAGAGDMSKGIDEGLKEMAQSQIDMLDGLIAMLELIVKMQELGDLDIDDSGTIEFGELFKIDDNGKIDYDTYADKYDEWRLGLLDLLKLKEGDEGYNKDLLNAIRGIMIGDMSFENILGLTASELSDLDASALQAYTAFVNAMVKAAESGDYDLDNIAESVKQVLAASGIGEDISITVGDTTLVINGGEITLIDWKNADTAKVLELYLEKTGKDRQELIKKIEEYNQGQFNSADLKWVLAVLNKVILDKKGDVVSVEWNGNTYEGTEANAAMYALALEDAGVEAGNIELNPGTAEKATATGTLTVGSLEIEVYSDEKGIHFVSSRGAGDFHSLDDLLQAEYENEVFPSTRKEYSFEQWKWGAYHLRTLVQTTIEDKNGQVVTDLNKDPTIRDELTDLLNTYKPEDLAKLLNLKNDGNYELTLPVSGAKLTIDGSTIALDAEGNVDAAKLGAELSSLLGLDDNLIDNITKGITNAIPKIADELSNLFSDTENAGAMSSALSAIASSLSTIAGISLTSIIELLSNFFSNSTTAGGENTDNTLSVDSVDIIPSNINILVDGVPTNLVGILESIEIETLDATLQKLLLKFTGTPDSSTLKFNSIDYLDTVKALISSLLLIQKEGVTPKLFIKNKEIPITDILTGLVQNLNINTDDAHITPSSITLPDGYEVPIGEIAGAAEKLLVTWKDNIPLEPDLSNLDLPTSIEGPDLEIVRTVKVTFNPELTDTYKDENGVQHFNYKEQTPKGPVIEPDEEYPDTTGKAPAWLGFRASAGMSDVKPSAKVKTELEGSGAEAVEEMASGQILAEATLDIKPGNVDLENRKIISAEDMAAAGWDIGDDYATLFTLTYTSAPEADVQLVINATPIAPDGTVFDESYMYDYIENTLLGDGTNTWEDVLRIDAENLGLVINLADVEGDMDEAIAIMELKAEEIHELQAEIFDELAMSGEAQIDTSSAEENLNNLSNTADIAFDSVTAIDGSTVNVSAPTSGLLNLINALNNIRNVITAINNTSVNPKTSGTSGGGGGINAAKGNVALAAGTLQTLMGELGPELVVTNGHYFVAGQNGAEFVDLPKDAIVFNHLLTASLLKNGKAGRGAAVTSEMNAVSMATGNMSGPAMASASAALAALKQLRDEWQALLNVSVKDLAGKGGGGGGGGGGSDSNSAERKAWIDQVERWYNLMLKIDQLEKDITHEETLRTKLNSDFNKNGKAYYESQKRSLQAIELQMIALEELNISREQYFKLRREQLNKDNGPFTLLYEFDENGLLKYKDKTGLKDDNGKEMSGYEFLSNLVATDDRGRSKYTAKLQYELLTNAGFKNWMLYDSSGSEIEKPSSEDDEDTWNTYYVNSVLAVWDRIESLKDEMLTLHDTIEEGLVNLLELENDRNELLEEIRNNQMEVENAVLDAIVDLRLRAIDDLTDLRNALEDSTNKFIQGLSDSLNLEKQMYENEQSSEELNKMRRQLAILQRSGGSGEQIRSLQSDIADLEKDMYFDLWQLQIDAILAASDKELERLDLQIDIMTKTLEFEKDYGLLWEEVYRVMDGSPAEIASFITTENSKFWGSSPLKSAVDMQDALFTAEQWKAFLQDQKDFYNAEYTANDNEKTTIADAVYGTDATDWNIFNTAMKNLFGENWTNIASQYKDKFWEEVAASGDITTATTDLTTGDHGLDALGEKLVSALSTPTTSGTSGGSSGDGSSSGSGSGSRSSTTVVGGNKGTGGGKVVTAMQKAAWAITDAARIAAGVVKIGSTSNKNMTPASKHVNLKVAYDRGGMIEKDGEIYAHAKESVLTPEQTSILRNDILGNNSNSLMNLLLDFKDAYSGIGSAASSIATSNSEAIIIQNATVEMNIDQIANDYDARRAGEKALEEMLRIASKTSAKNSIRR